MKEYQISSTFLSIYLRYLVPICPEQLSAPKLHYVLDYQPIQELIYGGKWIGSGGDGCLQLLARSEECQLNIIKILQQDLQLHSFKLSILRSL